MSLPIDIAFSVQRIPQDQISQIDNLNDQEFLKSSLSYHLSVGSPSRRMLEWIQSGQRASTIYRRSINTSLRWCDAGCRLRNKDASVLYPNKKNSLTFAKSPSPTTKKRNIKSK